MNSIQTDSGDDIATTTTTATPPLPKDTETTTSPKDTDQDVEVDQRSAKKRREELDRQALENAEAGQAREVGAGDILTARSGGDGGGRGRRLLLIGLDGAAPELAIGAWRTDLRTVEMLTNRGLRA